MSVLMMMSTEGGPGMECEHVFVRVTPMTDTFRCGHPKSVENIAPNGTGLTTCRECRNASKRNSRLRDLDAARASARERTMRYRRKNGVQEGHANSRKDVCAQGHEYTAENTYTSSTGWRQCRQCRRVRVAETYARRRDVYLERERQRRLANPEKHRAEVKAWAKANPEKAALTARIKRQRKRAAGNLSAADWRSVLAAYGTACLCCGSADEPPTIDHVIPLSRGGSNTIDNVQPLCNGCNMRKSTKTIDYRPHVAAVG